jgi:predicted DNA-binding protein
LAKEGGVSVPKQLLDKISIYVPKNKMEQRPVERLMKLAERKDRSVNYLVVEAIIEYLEREEKRKS